MPFVLISPVHFILPLMFLLITILLYDNLYQNSPKVDIWLTGFFFFTFQASIIRIIILFFNFKKKPSIIFLMFIIYLFFYSITNFVWTLFGTFCLIQADNEHENSRHLFVHLFSFLLQFLTYLTYIVLVIKIIKLELERRENEESVIKKKDTSTRILTTVYQNTFQLTKFEMELLITKENFEILKSELLDIEIKIIKEEFTNSNRMNLRYDTCSICLSDFGSLDQVSMVGCEHPFHFKCFIDWLKIKPRCPMCSNLIRKELLKRIVLKSY